METRNDIPNLLAMYIRNTREIYDITTWLQNCIIKKANKGIQPSIEYLANCSTMKTIIREAARTTRSKTQYKTVDTPFGATKRSKKHSVSGTARKRILKGIAKTTIAKS